MPAEQHENRHSLEQMKSDYSMGAGLDRSNTHMTVPMSSEVYERLFLQPTQARGDLSKRLGNPTLLGLLGFLIPFQTTIFCCLGWGGATASSTAAISGTYFFLGGIAMNVAGIFEFILGNSLPSAIFIIYGSHWCNLGYGDDPAVDLASLYAVGDVSGALATPYNAGNAFYNVTMGCVSFVFFIACLRTNIPFAMALFCLCPLFWFFAAADFHIAAHPTAAGLERAAYLIQIGAGFGFVTAICGWYLAVIASCASVGLPCPLPAFDLSKFGAKTDAAKMEHAGNIRREDKA